MSTSSHLGSISEGNILSSESEDSEGVNENNVENCRRLVQRYTRTNDFLIISVEKALEALNVVRKNGLLTEEDIEEATTKIFRNLLKEAAQCRSTFVGAQVVSSHNKGLLIFEEIDNVNIYTVEFFTTIASFVKKLDPMWTLQIVEGFSKRFQNDEIEARQVDTLCQTCHEFLKFIKICFGNHLENPNIIKAAKSIIILLFKGIRKKQETMIIQDNKNYLESVLQRVDKILKNQSVSSDIDQKWKLIQAIHRIENKGRKHGRIQEGLEKINELLNETQDNTIRQFCKRWKEKAEDILHCSSRVSQSSDDTSQPKTKKKKRKTKPRSSSAPLGDESVDTDVVKACDQFSESGSTITRTSEDGCTSEETMNRLKFIEEFPYKFCKKGKVYKHIEDKGFVVPSLEEGKSIVEAVWDVIRAVGGRLKKLTFFDFETRLKSIAKKEDPSIMDDHRILQHVADEYFLNITVISSVHPLVPDITIMPRKERHEKQIPMYLFHRTNKVYVGLFKQVTAVALPCNRSGSTSVPTENVNSDPSPTVKADLKPKPEWKSDMSENMSKLLKRLSWLRKFQSSDDFLAGMNTGKNSRHKSKYVIKERNYLSKVLKEEPKRYKRCTLHLQGAHEGYAIPCMEEGENGPKEPREKILLTGRRNCGMAFDKDIVVVDVFRDTHDNIEGGQVIGVEKSDIRPVNQLFFCKVCKDQTTLMKPICGTFPKIHIANDPAQEEYAKNHLPDAMNVYNFGAEHGFSTRAHEERANTSYANKCLVCVFDVIAGEDKKVHFKIKSVEPIQRHICEDIFIVVYKQWNRHYIYPYGYVVAVIKPTRSPADELAIMRLQNQLPHYYEGEKEALQEAQQIYKRADKDAQLRNRKDFRGKLTFTIDNDDTEDMDDAISVERINKEKQLVVSIHVTDVSHYVKHNTYLDRAARERAFTVYGVPNSTKPVHMFPEHIATDRLSLLKNKDRLCLTVVIKFDEETLSLIPEEDENIKVMRSVIKSNHKLTKKEVSKMIRDETQESTSSDYLNIRKAVKVLWQCTRELRTKRLKNAAYYHNEDLSDLSEIGETFEAGILIEELMVETNCRVAKYLMKQFPKLAIFRTHLPPESAEIHEWTSNHKKAIYHSGTLGRTVDLLRISQDRFRVEEPLYFSSDVVKKIEEALKNKDYFLPFLCLAAERLHPSLLMAIEELSLISKRALYERSNSDGNDATSNRTSHFDLNVRAYVHFTSPLRRYTDIINHRLIHAAIDGKQPSFDVIEIDKITEQANEMARRMKLYEKSLLLYRLYLKAESVPLSLPCTVSEMTMQPPRVVLNNKLISKLPLSTRSFTFGELTLDGNPESKRSQSNNNLLVSLTCKWQHRLFIVDKNERNQHPNLRSLIVTVRSCDNVCSFERQYYMEHLGRSYTIPLHSLLNFYPSNRWNQVMKNKFKEVSNQDTKKPDITSEMKLDEDSDSSTFLNKKKESSSSLNKKKDSSTSSNHSTGKKRRIVIEPAVKFTVDFELEKPIRAQFSAPTARVARMRTPELQYLQVCESFGICLEHVSDPEKCFGDDVGGVIEENRHYENVTDYQNTWLPVLRMEGITESMKDANSFFLSGVEIEWMTGDKNIAGLFLLKDHFCRDPYRQIHIGPEGTLFDCNKLDNGYINFLCIRVKLEDYWWIAHAGVKFCSTTINNEHLVFFKVHKKNSPFNEDIIKRLAVIEFIVKTNPKRRQESAVELLSQVPDTTAIKIALGKFETGEGLGDQLNHLECLYNDNFRDKHLHTARCNYFQQRAIENSFKWPISLIWGPPGTGKTITGVQITFWYTKFNKKMEKKKSFANEETVSIDDANNSDEITTDGTNEDNEQASLIHQNSKSDKESVSEDDENDGNEETTLLNHTVVDLTAPINTTTNDLINTTQEIDHGWEIQRYRRNRKHTNSSTEDSGVASGVTYQASVSASPISSVYQPTESVSDNELLRWINFPEADKNVILTVPLTDRKRQVLYCGPSNDCVNCVANHLRTKVEIGCVSLLRVFSEQVELKEYPIPGFDASFSRLNTQVQVPENLLEICLHRLVRQIREGENEQKKYYANKLQEFDEAFERVFAYLEGKAPYDFKSTYIQLEMFKHLRQATRDYNAVLRAAKSLELREHDVILCTTAVSASTLLQENCRFCQVIIDETGMCTEAETLVPLVPVCGQSSASAAIENVVLIGDHKQLKPILLSQMAADLGLERSMLQRHWTAGHIKNHPNGSMLKIQYRMHPSICEFPSNEVYQSRLKTGVSQLWSGLGDEEIKWSEDNYYKKMWTGLNPEICAKKFYKEVLRNGNSDIFNGSWPKIKHRFRCMKTTEEDVKGKEERVVFLHVEGEEQSLSLTTNEGNENSKSNMAEVNEVVRIYMTMRSQFSQPRNALGAITVLSQYQSQVHEINVKLKEELSKTVKSARVCNLFKNRTIKDRFRDDPKPSVSTVVRSQGSEYDYVILSTVRSLPARNIDPDPTPGWEKKYLGFITDTNQINVAITRARKGLIIIGNGNLLRVHKFWKRLIENLESRGCYYKNSKNFP